MRVFPFWRVLIPGVLGLVLLSAGCVGPTVEGPEGTRFIVPQATQDALQAKNPATDSFSTMVFAPLPMGEAVTAHLTIDSPAFVFPQGKSFYLAYRLPRCGEPCQVDLKSWFDGSVFFPKVLVLDEEFQVIEEIGAPVIAYHEPGLIVRGHVGGVFDLPIEKQPAYLIIYTTPEIMRGILSSSESGYVVPTATVTTYVPSRSYQHEFGPVGKLTVRVMPKRSR